MYTSQINSSALSSTSADMFESSLVENQPSALRPSQVQNTAEIIETYAQTANRIFRELATSAGIGLGLGVASVALMGMSDNSVDTVEAVSSHAAVAFGLAGLTVACTKGLVAAVAHYVSPTEAMSTETLEEVEIGEIEEVETDSEAEAEIDLEMEALFPFKKIN